ncbi:MAG: DNA polymerase III subunit gamma/tau, partial [Thermoplasmatota archaeon]
MTDVKRIAALALGLLVLTPEIAGLSGLLDRAGALESEPEQARAMEAPEADALKGAPPSHPAPAPQAGPPELTAAEAPDPSPRRETPSSQEPEEARGAAVPVPAAA